MTPNNGRLCGSRGSRGLLRLESRRRGFGDQAAIDEVVVVERVTGGLASVQHLVALGHCLNR